MQSANSNLTFWFFWPPLMSRLRCKGQVRCYCSVVLYYCYYCYIVQLNMTIYRQNSYKLLTIHKNEFRKTKNISKNDQNGSKMTQNGSKMVVSIQISIFAVGQGFFEQKVPTPLEFSLSFCYLNTPHPVVLADFEITKLSPPPSNVQVRCN